MTKYPRLKRALFMCSGMVALLLTYVGIIIPGFPAIPFLILAAYFFANSSPRIYAWMMRQRLLKKLITKSQQVDRRVFKALMISQVWFSVVVAEITLAHSTTARLLFAFGGVVLTVLVLILVKRRSTIPKGSGPDT